MLNFQTDNLLKNNAIKIFLGNINMNHNGEISERQHVSKGTFLVHL